MNDHKAEALDVEALEQYILTAMERWTIPGLTIAIVKDDKTVLCKGYGIRDINEKTPVDKNTLFAISNSTACFTTAALALLVAEGKLDWHDRLIDLIPYFKTGDAFVTEHATVADVLAIRTGLADEALSFHPHPDRSRTEIISHIQHAPSMSPFRAELGGATSMTVAVGELIPALTGISWDDFVRDRLFKPLGMTDSITGPDQLTGNHNVATPHESIEGKLTAVPHAQTANMGPAIAMYSSAADMAEWLKFQLNNGKAGDKVILPEEQIPPLRASYLACNFDFPGIVKNFVNRGLGVLISDSTSGHKLYSNGGDVDGMESFHTFVPEINLGVAVMINCTQVMPQPVVAWVVDRCTGAPERDWVSEMVPFYAEQNASVLSQQKIQQQAITDTSKPPSYPLAEYAGLYRHPVLGDFNIEAKADHLAFRLGSVYRGELAHANHDTFFIQVNEPHIGKYFFYGPVQFQLDMEGKVNSLIAMDKPFQRVNDNA